MKQFLFELWGRKFSQQNFCWTVLHMFSTASEPLKSVVDPRFGSTAVLMGANFNSKISYPIYFWYAPVHQNSWGETKLTNTNPWNKFVIPFHNYVDVILTWCVKLFDLVKYIGRWSQHLMWCDFYLYNWLNYKRINLVFHIVLCHGYLITWEWLSKRKISTPSLYIL